MLQRLRNAPSYREAGSGSLIAGYNGFIRFARKNTSRPEAEGEVKPTATSGPADFLV